MRRILLFLVLGAALFQADCARTTSASSGSHASPGTPPQTPPPASITVTVAPNPVTVRAGLTQPFTATVTGSANTSVTWQVNSVTGGAASIGTITSTGVYTAPATLPSPNTVTVQAVSVASSSASGQSVVTLWNPVPVLAGISPTSVPEGAISITVTGSSFVNGAQVMLGGSALTTT